VYACNPILRRLRQEDSEFEASPHIKKRKIYTVKNLVLIPATFSPSVKIIILIVSSVSFHR
jgi:hypothetical protein